MEVSELKFQYLVYPFHSPSLESLEGSVGLHFAKFVLVLNKHLKPLGFELCRSCLEEKEEFWYAVVNRTPDVAAKIGSKFTPHELEFFNLVVSNVAKVCSC